MVTPGGIAAWSGAMVFLSASNFRTLKYKSSRSDRLQLAIFCSISGRKLSRVISAGPLGTPAVSLSDIVTKLRGAAICVIAVVALSGCASGNGPGQLLVAPGTYDAYKCKDLT